MARCRGSVGVLLPSDVKLGEEAWTDTCEFADGKTRKLPRGQIRTYPGYVAFTYLV